MAAAGTMPPAADHGGSADAVGVLPVDSATDGLHLNDRGYALLAEHLAPHLPAPRGA